MGTRRVIGGCAAVLVALVLTAPAAAATSCDSSSIASASALRKLNAVMWKLGPRPTGSPAQQRFIDYLDRQLQAIPGLRVRSLRYPIMRRDIGSATLTVPGVGDLPIAAPVPYAGSGTATAPLVRIPDDQPITAANAAGKIVVRDAPPGEVPTSVFSPALLGWWQFDPGHTLDPSAPYVGDFINYDDRLHDMEDAGAAGAAGVVFLKDLPRDQLAGHYEPYEGEHFTTPGVYLGADEAERLTGATTATISVSATDTPAVTRTLVATLPGRSDERLMVESHTDGVNAVWDNGPLAILAMARTFAALPQDCRPKTLQFAFTTGHLYQRLVSDNVRDGGAEQLAEQLDRDYNKGTVAGVVALEHLGAREYAAQPRGDGGPGNTLVPTGQPEHLLVSVSDSAKLVGAVRKQVVRHDLVRTSLLKGADVEGDHVPAHCSFGGEGTPYNKHLLPTVGLIAAPQTLYDPPFGLEGIDFGLMRRQTLAASDLLLALGPMSRKDIAGNVPAMRRQRAAGATVCPWYP